MAKANKKLKLLCKHAMYIRNGNAWQCLFCGTIINNRE